MIRVVSEVEVCGEENRKEGEKGGGKTDGGGVDWVKLLNGERSLTGTEKLSKWFDGSVDRWWIQFPRVDDLEAFICAVNRNNVRDSLLLTRQGEVIGSRDETIYHHDPIETGWQVRK